jgi:hypothetical protein
MKRPAWIVAAVLAWTVNPIALFVTIWPTGVGRDCASPPGSPMDVPPGCPREGLAWLAGMFMLAVWLIATGLVAFTLGVIAGCHRHFVRGAVVPAVLITVAMPWAMAGYALGAGIGHLALAATSRPRTG